MNHCLNLAQVYFTSVVIIFIKAGLCSVTDILFMQETLPM
ncbi:hypothetical protein PFLA_a4026 [Pseudoalteromonas flavipulchra NCIMB 2033 = ATCC BAA-314]|nr:hypothetical protein [Pseudoalteromonas flavipulchra NCIMB 2033 = ATCC BAA-314]